jgi:uncharacterized radical SAM superfamily Fe-S cluster-containing enzyme
MLNTNGLRLAQEPDFVRQLARYRPTVYLQFDGLTASTYQAVRGRDLRTIKQQALDHLADAGLYAVLVATVVQGVNEGEIGDILRYGLGHPAVLGVSYQPVTFAGRCLWGALSSQRFPARALSPSHLLHLHLCFRGRRTGHPHPASPGRGRLLGLCHQPHGA